MDESWKHNAKKPVSRPNIKWFNLCEMSRTDKSIETEHRLMVV